MITKWKFDYNMVAVLDPDYVKYLDDSRTSCNEDLLGRELSTGHFQDAIASTDTHYQSTRKDLNEEEQDVLDLVYATREEAPPVPAGPVRHAEAVDSLANDEIRANETSLGDGLFMTAEEKQKARKERRENNPLMQVPNYYVLKEEYRDPKEAKNPIPIERQLPPPKTVCDIGTEVLYNNNIYHKLTPSSEYNDASVNITRVKFSISKGMIRLMYSQYWFDRIRNISSERKKEFRALVYNPKTKQMYFRGFDTKKVSNFPKRHKYTAKIRNCGIVPHMVETVLSYTYCCPAICNKFLRAVFDAIKKDVSDACFDDNELVTDRAGSYHNATYQLCHGILEHKVGKRIDWLTKPAFKRLVNIMDNKTLLINLGGLRIDGGPNKWSIGNKKAVGERARRIKSIVPRLRKHNNLQSFVEAVLGRWYSKIMLDIFYWDKFADHFYIDALTAFTLGMPKIAYHYLVGIIRHALNNSPNAKVENAVMEAVAAIIYALDDIRQGADNNTDRWFRSYVMFCKRMTDPANGKFGPVPRWDMWRDMYQMANAYNIRIRPNKFRASSDVNNTHRRLYDIQNRDRRVIRDLADKVFEPFAHPDKEYNGFKFVHLTKPEELVHEGRTMHHCVGGYSSRCLSGGSLIFSMRKDDRSYVTIELKGANLVLHQKYTIHDFTVENKEILDPINEWHNDVLDMHAKDELSYYDICQYKQKKEQLNRRNEAKKILENMTVPPTPEDICAIDDINYALEA